MDSAAPRWADLWAPENSEAYEFREARRAIQARELDDLRAMGVDVDDPAALAAARADRYVMARLLGRQLRELLEVRRRQGWKFNPTGMAEELHAARERHNAAVAAGEKPW